MFTFEGRLYHTDLRPTITELETYIRRDLMVSIQEVLVNHSKASIQKNTPELAEKGLLSVITAPNVVVAVVYRDTLNDAPDEVETFIGDLVIKEELVEKGYNLAQFTIDDSDVLEYINQIPNESYVSITIAPKY